MRAVSRQAKAGRMKGQEGLFWREKSRKFLLDCRIFRVQEAESVSSEGKIGKFSILDAPDWAAVVPLIQRGGESFFLMVRQFRHGSGALSLEFPGGVVENGEDPGTAVRRELLEETGYEAAKLTKLGAMNPNPAFMNNTFHAFLAEGLELRGAQALDEHEYLDVELVPVDAAHRTLGENPSAHALMLAALALYDRRLLVAPKA
jgi:ADP-ribose pyrophosphatase